MTDVIRPIPDIEYELALMQFIKTRGDVRSLLKATDDDVTKMCNTVDHLIEQGFVVKQGNTLEMTDDGISHIRTLNKRLGRKGFYRCFLPDYSKRRVQMSIADPYIPQYMFKRGGRPF